MRGQGELKIAIVVAAVMACAPSGRTEQRGEYERGVEAFKNGRDELAAELFVEAVRRNPECFYAIVDRDEQDRLPQGPCAAGRERREAGRDIEARLLFELAVARKAGAREGPERRLAGRWFLKRVIEQHPDAGVADDAALELVTSGFCVTDAGYPGCVQWRIKGYEGWLTKYPYSDRRWEVAVLTAEACMKLAERFEQQEPWRSAIKAELCRGKALGLAEMVVASGSDQKASAAARRIIGEIKGKNRPYSIVPGLSGPLVAVGAD